MKVHTGADVDDGLAHTTSVTPANVADITELPNLLREVAQAAFDDEAYANKHYIRDNRAPLRADAYQGLALKARPKSRLATRHVRNRETGSTPPSAVVSIISFGSSHACMATPRPDTKIWLRMPRRSPPRSD